jgi:hypothetical protein
VVADPKCRWTEDGGDGGEDRDGGFGGQRITGTSEPEDNDGDGTVDGGVDWRTTAATA